MLAVILAALMPVLHMPGGLLSIGESFAQAGHRYTVKAYNYKHHLAAVSQDGSPPILTKFKVEPIQDSCLQIASTAPIIACGAVLSTVNPNNPVYDYKSVVIQNLILTNGAHTLTPGNCLQLDATDNSVETASVACGGTVTAGTTQNGTDPGGGICVSGTTVNLCGAITATTTFSAGSGADIALGLVGTNQISSASTSGDAFQLNNTGSSSGNLLSVQKNGTTEVFVDTNGKLTISSNGSGQLAANGTVSITAATLFSLLYTAAAGTIANSNTNQTTFNCSTTSTNNHSCYFFAAPVSGTGSVIVANGKISVQTNCTGATPVTCAGGIGNITLSSGSGTVNFTPNFASAPICFTKDITTPANVLTLTIAAGSLAISGGTTTDVVDYGCFGTNVSS